MDAQDDKMWILDKMGFPPDFDERARLLRLDLSNGTWRMHAHYWPHQVAPVDMDVVRDAFVDQVLLGVRGYGPPMSIVPEIYVLDVGSGSVQHVPIEHSPHLLHAVPVP